MGHEGARKRGQVRSAKRDVGDYPVCTSAQRLDEFRTQSYLYHLFVGYCSVLSLMGVVAPATLCPLPGTVSKMNPNMR